MNISKKIYGLITHLLGRITKRYYFEDFVRSYPDGIRFNRFGRRIKANQKDINGFLNHIKVYKFAAQFVKDKIVADIGCGSGFGCAILQGSGAKSVYGADISKDAIRFAKNKYGTFANFTVQGITALTHYLDNYFDITISVEVLEHIKEYNKEKDAVKEMKRITKKNGLIVLDTPNSEISGAHGFSFDEINNICRDNFGSYVIFENALIPTGEKRRRLWEERFSKGRTGIIVSQNINLSETPSRRGQQIELKKGIDPGIFKFANYDVDTSLLHNTGAWIILAIC